ncbi:MAG: hypothetical protein ACE5GL_04645 [Calditrichia bacterium]
MDYDERINKKSVRIRTWFGVKAVVEVGNGFWHKAGFGRFLIPHPPLVNWLLRLGLPDEEKNRLGLTHEFGHFQTLPFYLIYTAVLIGLFFSKGYENIAGLIFVFISTHAFWEILTELYTISCLGPLYKLYYRGISFLPRIIFWVIVTAFVLSGWSIVLV